MIEPYDEMRDDFNSIMCENDAKHCLERYGYATSFKFMPRKYLYLLGKVGFEHLLSQLTVLEMHSKKLKEENDILNKFLEDSASLSAHTLSEVLYKDK